MATAAGSIDEYLAGVREGQRQALQHLRETIRSAAPDAVECISYQLPAFRLHGRLLVAFGAAAHHCALYPMSAATTETFRAELTGFDTSKGAIRFQPDRPLPDDLVRRLVAARIAENARRVGP